MVRSKLAMGFVVGLFWIAVSVPSGAVAADDAAPPGLDNTACLSCHDGEHGDLEVPAADDETRTLTPVEPGAFANSVHADMACVERSEENTSELQSLMRVSYAVCCLKNNIIVRAIMTYC